VKFTPSADVAVILHALLDKYERRFAATGPPEAEGHGRRTIRCDLTALSLPGYFNQADPVPRQVANEQLQQLDESGLVKLAWLPGESGHLLASAALAPDRAGEAYTLLQRTPLAAWRARLTELLLGERFRFSDWRLRAVQNALVQLQAGKSPAPFCLADDEFNRDLLTALAALDGVPAETPYRVFSVRVFNDSKRFEALAGALTTLARRHQAALQSFSSEEVLRELNLVANPGHLYLHGSWELVGDSGQIVSLREFEPSVGIPAAQAARLRRVRVDAPRVIGVENLTSFYELIRSSRSPLAAVCLWGNPSPACRHLLRCLPEEVPFHVWADLDYGGLNLLAQLRERVNPRALPYRMDIETLEAHAAWAKPLTPGDVRNLARLARRPALADMQPLIQHLLRRSLKLEQEAVVLPVDDLA